MKIRTWLGHIEYRNSHPLPEALFLTEMPTDFGELGVSVAEFGLHAPGIVLGWGGSGLSF